MTSDSTVPSFRSLPADETLEAKIDSGLSEDMEGLPFVEDESSIIDLDSQVYLKPQGEYLLLMLPEASEQEDWSVIKETLHHCLQGRDRVWQNEAPVHLIAKDRLIDSRQLQDLTDALAQADLNLQKVVTSRRQTAVAAATAGYSVTQQSRESFATQYSQPNPGLVEPLYWKSVLRSGMEISHPGTVILIGDLNPGASIVAAGDILVWGNLRGVTHAGADGNHQSRIFALRMEPTQLRIAENLARAPEKPPNQYEPEVAYVTTEGIRLTKAQNFSKLYTFSPEAKGWTASNNH